jgi:hypothetical protein
MLRVYEEVIALVRDVRGVVEEIEKRDGDLARQMRRAMASVALNIAEANQLLVTVGNPTCDACAASNCCTQLNACFDPLGGDCDQLQSCLETCVDEAGSPSTDAGAQCSDNCFTAHPSGKTPWLTQAQCLANSCQTECGL